MEAHIYEVFVGGSELDVEDFLECSFCLLTNREGSLVHHWVVFEMIMSQFIELFGTQIKELTLNWGIEVMHDLAAKLLSLHLFGGSIEEVSDQLDVVFSEGDKLFLLDKLLELNNSDIYDLFGIHASISECHNEIAKEHFIFSHEPGDVLESELEVMVEMENWIVFDQVQNFLLLQFSCFGSHHHIFEGNCLLNDTLFADLEDNHFRFGGDDIVLRNTRGTVLEFSYLREIEEHLEPLGCESVELNNLAVDGPASENWKTTVGDLEHRSNVPSLAGNVRDDDFANVDFVKNQSRKIEFIISIIRSLKCSVPMRDHEVLL